MSAPAWSDPDIRRLSFGSQLRRNAQARPDDLVYTHGARTLTWQQLHTNVDRLAAALYHDGVCTGSRVATVTHNSLDNIEIYLATATLGAIGVPINYRLVADEIAYILNDSQPQIVFTDSANRDTVAAAVSRSAGTIIVVTIGDEHAEIGITIEEFVSAGGEHAPLIDVAEDQPAFIIYTSGTTGRPKGAVLTHLNLISSALAVGMATGGRPPQPDVRLLSVPMFHIAGLANVLGPMLDGGRVVLAASDEFDPMATLGLLEAEQITSCFLVPTQWDAVCAAAESSQHNLALRLPYWGASAAPPSVLQALARTFPDSPAYSAFGMTETSAITTMLSGPDALCKQGSVGRPIPLVQARIVDDQMQDVAVGQVGEIVYRGPTVMREYWRDPVATAEAFTGGWFHSGDMCKTDEDGFIWVVDRKKDMIISGGENISCAEVEAAILSHPDVAEVAVVGIAHPRWVQTPCAVIVAANSADPPAESDIIDHCRGLLASFKKPTKVVVVDTLPRNASGKVLKFEIRDQLNALDGQR